MTLPRLLLVLALMSTPMTTPAHADMSPPKVNPFAPPGLPGRVKTWFTAAAAAMNDGAIEKARALCDPRGFEVDLTGEGGPLADLFSQGHLKKWHLVGVVSRSKPLIQKASPGRLALPLRTAYLIGADVVGNDPAKKGKALDALYILLVPGPDGDLVALGASESKDAALALAKRWTDNALPPGKD